MLLTALIEAPVLQVVRMARRTGLFPETESVHSVRVRQPPMAARVTVTKPTKLGPRTANAPIAGDPPSLQRWREPEVRKNTLALDALSSAVTVTEEVALAVAMLNCVPLRWMHAPLPSHM